MSCGHLNCCVTFLSGLLLHQLVYEIRGLSKQINQVTPHVLFWPHFNDIGFNYNRNFTDQYLSNRNETNTNSFLTCQIIWVFKIKFYGMFRYFVSNAWLNSWIFLLAFRHYYIYWTNISDSVNFNKAETQEFPFLKNPSIRNQIILVSSRKSITL